MSLEHAQNQVPIAVGGVGGSGTRVVARILQAANLYMGGDLNDSLDNLWFTLLFKYRSVLQLPEREFERRVIVFLRAMRAVDDEIADWSGIEALARTEREQHDVRWLQDRLTSLKQAASCHPREIRWGWKEPNTHLIIDRLWATLPHLKYVHVARNGLDMAFSENQNQLRLWGPTALGTSWSVTPAASLSFWCWAHRRIFEIGRRRPSQFLFIKLEKLCKQPHLEIARLLEFSEVSLPKSKLEEQIELLQLPASTNRYKRFDCSILNAADVHYAQSIGYCVE